VLFQKFPHNSSQKFRVLEKRALLSSSPIHFQKPLQLQLQKPLKTEHLEIEQINRKLDISTSTTTQQATEPCNGYPKLSEIIFLEIIWLIGLGSIPGMANLFFDFFMEFGSAWAQNHPSSKNSPKY
jgi:hypothetical protein